MGVAVPKMDVQSFGKSDKFQWIQHAACGMHHWYGKVLTLSNHKYPHVIVQASDPVPPPNAHECICHSVLAATQKNLDQTKIMWQNLPILELSALQRGKKERAGTDG